MSNRGDLLRRDVLKLAAAGAVGAMLPTAPARAQSDAFPVRPITVANVFQAGGSFDQLMRAVEPSLTKALGQPVKQEFIPGANGALAMTRVITQKPEGYWLAIDAISNFQISTWFGKPQAYNAESFTYLGTLMVEPLALLVRKESPFASIEDLMKAARSGAAPTVGVTQPKGFYHLAAAIFRDVAKSNLKIINYGGGGPARNALLSGEVDCSVTGLFSAAPILDRLRNLVVFAGTNPLATELPAPTVDQVLGAGRMPDVQHPTALIVPVAFKQQHPDQFRLLSAKLNEAMAAASTRELTERMGFPAAGIVCWTPEDCETYARAFAGTLRNHAGALG